MSLVSYFQFYFLCVITLMFSRALFLFSFPDYLMCINIVFFAAFVRLSVDVSPVLCFIFCMPGLCSLLHFGLNTIRSLIKRAFCLLLWVHVDKWVSFWTDYWHLLMFLMLVSCLRKCSTKAGCQQRAFVVDGGSVQNIWCNQSVGCRLVLFWSIIQHTRRWSET